MFLQNGDLKKQLHERQPRIAALSDKQVSEGARPLVEARGPGGVAWHFDSTLKSASVGATHADSPRGLSPVLKVIALPPFWGERAGSWRWRGEREAPAVAEKDKLHLKGAGSPASILSWWTCFWNV